MKDIAEKIGVDRSTVSLALKNDPRISRATKDKVLATADELGYRPDPAFKVLGAQRWKSRKTATGFVMAFIASKTQLDDPIAQRYLEGFRSEAHKLGFGFSEFNISEYDSIMKANQVLIHRGVSGLVFFRPPQEKDLYGYDWDQFASICLGYGSFKPPMNAVEHDQSANLQLLWEKARQTGATRVGVVLCKNLKSFDYIHNLGAAGFQQELDASVAPIPKFVYCPDSKRQQTISDLNDWIAAYSPQVVIGDSDSVCEMLMQTGAAVPEDISFLSLRSGIGHRPSLPSHMHTSGISLCIREAGQVAANLLSMQIQNNNRGLPAVRITHLIQTNYITGHTLRPQVR